MQAASTVLEQLSFMQSESSKEGIRRVSFEWTKGLITGVNELELGKLGGIVDCNGLVVREREISRTRGLLSTYTTTINGNPIGIYQHVDLSGNRTVFLLTETYLYLLSGTTWLVVSTYSGAESYRPSFESWQDVMLFTSYNDEVMAWNPATNRPITTPALAKSTTPFKKIANGLFDYMVGGVRLTKDPAETAFTASHIVSSTKWGVFKVCIASNGTVTTVVPSSTQAYDTEALAIAAMPATTSGTAYIGYLTVNAPAGWAWSANTHNLTDGDGCQEANFYSLTSDLTLDAFSSVVTKAGCLALFKSRLILGMLNEDGTASPWRVKWSTAGTYNTFTGVGSGFQDLLDTPGSIVAMQTIFDRLFIFKTDSIWECVYVGSPNIFSIVPVVFGVGLSARSTLDIVPGLSGNAESVVFLGNDDVYSFDGRTAKPIGGEYIQEYIFGVNSVVDPVYRGRSVGKYVKEDKQYWLTIPLTGSSYPDLTLICDFLNGSWWKTQFGVPIRCMGDSVESGSQTWKEITGTWNASAAKWDDTYLALGAVKVLVGSSSTAAVVSRSTQWNDMVGTWNNSKAKWNEDAAIYEVDFSSYNVAGVVPDAHLETPDQMYDMMTRWFQFTVELKGLGGATLYYSSDEGANWFSAGSKTGKSNLFSLVSWYLNITREKMRFKLVLDSSTVGIRKNQAFIALRTA